MSIRPVDMQVMLPKIDQNFYAKQSVVNRNLNEQANFVEINNRDSQRKRTMVRESEESAKNDSIRRDKDAKEESSKDSNPKEDPQEQAHAQKERSGYENRNYDSFGKVQKSGGAFFDLKI